MTRTTKKRTCEEIEQPMCDNERVNATPAAPEEPAAKSQRQARRRMNNVIRIGPSRLKSDKTNGRTYSGSCRKLTGFDMPRGANKRQLQNVTIVTGLTGSVRRSGVQTWNKNKSKLNKPPAANPGTLLDIEQMMAEVNPFMQQFLNFAERLRQDQADGKHVVDMEYRLHEKRSNSRTYNLSTVSEVGATLIEDGNLECPRDILLWAKDHNLLRLFESNPM
ncbi:unnamed protein product [Phytophthora fragariaefolia]|uniref:Unnamed protein product n=1 Tax=Phytophthora fragariaefolia TaxID=1490495 RepID=A0A9W6U2Y5_9STRA|nr:unnamed protein product [Phytophthora fragariaefolia]